jgi:hypothetical protein
MEEYIYYVKLGSITFYVHPDCLDEEDEKHFNVVIGNDVPDKAICGVCGNLIDDK